MENSERAAVIVKVKLNLSAIGCARRTEARFNVSRKISSRMTIPEENIMLYELLRQECATFSIRSIFGVSCFMLKLLLLQLALRIE